MLKAYTDEERIHWHFLFSNYLKTILNTHTNAPSTDICRVKSWTLLDFWQVGVVFSIYAL